jgi:hypothetical protein
MDLYLEVCKIVETTKIDGLTKSLKSKTELWKEIEAWNTWPTLNGSEKIYLYYHQKQKPTCICGSGKYLGFKSFALGYNEFCSSSCEPAKKVATERRVAAMIKSGGIGLANPKTKAKARSTLETSKGVVNPGQIEEHRLNMLENNPMGTEVGQASYQKTMFERYGVSNPAQRHFSEECRIILNNDLMFEDYLEKYGVMGLANYLNIGWGIISQKGRLLGLINPNKSIYEDEISKFLAKHNINFKQHDRTLIKPKELDFLLTTERLAIEFCGLFFHTETGGGKNRNYHIEKYQKCAQQNIQLLTIFEDEWVVNSNKWKNRILILCNKLELHRIHARKCQILEISSKEALPFLERNHLQSSTPSKIYIGAYYNCNLIAVMTFALSRDNKTLELNRFCSLSGVVIPGIASKLFAFFEKTYKPSAIVSFSDNRYSNGGIYPILGFCKVKDLPADYSYVNLKTNQRYHKFAFSKSKILKVHNFEKTMTEWEMMQELGYDRIWDCGKIKWVWNAK